MMNPTPVGAKKSPFIYRDQATLEIRTGGGCISIFGLPFLLVGLFIMQIPLGLVPMEETPSSLVLIPFGAVFAVVGAALVFGRSGIILDRARGRVVQWYGLIVPLKRIEYFMDAVEQVEMDFSSGDSESAATWPVKISGRGLTKPISVSAPTSFTEARQLAEELSRFLQKPLVDTSTGERIIRDPSHLNESYRDRIRRTGESVNFLPPEPSIKRSRVEQTGEGIIIHLDATPRTGLLYISIFLSVIFAVGVAWFFIPVILISRMPDHFRYIIAGSLVILFVLVPVLSAFRTLYQMKKDFERITVTRAFLRVETMKQGKLTTAEIPADELDDLVAPTTQGIINSVDLPDMKKTSIGDTGTPRMPDGRPVPGLLLSIMKMVGTKGIIARSDTTIMEFAAGLTEAEVAWLFGLIRKTIAG
mgnify:FL=1